VRWPERAVSTSRCCARQARGGGRRCESILTAPECMCWQAQEAVREALDAREDAVCRREEQLALRASEMRDAESTMQQLDVRRHQAQHAIAKLSDIQRQQDATLAQTHARQREVQMCARQVEEREQRLEEGEKQLARRQEELIQEEARIHQLRAAADVASIKDKQVDKQVD